MLWRTLKPGLYTRSNRTSGPHNWQPHPARFGLHVAHSPASFGAHPTRLPSWRPTYLHGQVLHRHGPSWGAPEEKYASHWHCNGQSKELACTGTSRDMYFFFQKMYGDDIFIPMPIVTGKRTATFENEKGGDQDVQGWYRYDIRDSMEGQARRADAVNFLRGGHGYMDSSPEGRPSWRNSEANRSAELQQVYGRSRSRWSVHRLVRFSSPKHESRAPWSRSLEHCQTRFAAVLTM